MGDTSAALLTKRLPLETVLCSDALAAAVAGWPAAKKKAPSGAFGGPLGQQRCLQGKRSSRRNGERNVNHPSKL